VASLPGTLTGGSPLQIVLVLQTPRYKAFLKRLKRVRRQAGLTQAQVARALGKPQGFVSKSETGERTVNALDVSDFAQVYGIPVEKLVPDSTAARLVRGTAGQSSRVAEPRKQRMGRDGKRPRSHAGPSTDK
jgi:transcriptional regulator with XRE-family HTH domain